MLPNLVVITLVGLLIGAFPAWPYSRDWGYLPSAAAGVILLGFAIYRVGLTV